MSVATLELAMPLLGYLLGAVPFAFLIGGMAGLDLRSVGSGNVGAGNLTRVAGFRYGAMAAVLDGLKGLVPVVIARRLGLSEAVAAAGGVMAVVGHNWSIYLRGRSGRGLATAVGVVLAVAPALLLWPAFWAVAGWRMGGGLGGFVGWGLLGPVALAIGLPGLAVATSISISLLVVLRRIQGRSESPRGVRPALERAIWDTDRSPEVLDAEQEAASG